MRRAGIVASDGGDTGSFDLVFSLITLFFIPADRMHQWIKYVLSI